jgi:ElaB/YqjD/DUF883 family membrane-anchored ribosome-binding protein
MTHQEEMDKRRKEEERANNFVSIGLGAGYVPMYTGVAGLGGAIVGALAGNLTGHAVDAVEPLYDKIKGTPTEQVAQLPDSKNFSHEANEAEGKRRVEERIKEIREKKEAQTPSQTQTIEEQAPKKQTPTQTIKKSSRADDYANNGSGVGGGVGLLAGAAVMTGVVESTRRKKRDEIRRKYGYREDTSRGV